MINMTRGVPAPESFPVDEFIEAFSNAMKEDGKKLLSYVAAPGYAPLIELIAGQEKVGTDQVLVGNSSLEFLQFLSMTETEAGDRVFMESPSYDRANLLMKRRGAVPVPIKLEVDGIDMDVFETELKKGAPKFFYTIPDFQNPMGTTCSLEKRKFIAEMAQKYNFLVLEDLPYRRLRYKGEDLPTIYSFAPDHVIKMSSFSKTLAPGLRLGYLTGRADVIERVKKWEGNTYIGPVSPTQGLAYQYLKSGKFEPNIVRLKALYAPRLEKALNLLKKDLPNAVYPKPEGGFFIGVTLPEGNDMETLLPAAKEAGLNLTDGRGFFVNREEGRRFLRIPFCGMKPEELQAAFDILVPLLVK